MAWNSLRFHFRDNCVGYRTREYTLVPMFVQWAFMRAGDYFQRAIFLRDIIDKEEHCYHIVIGVWLEEKVLVIFYLGCGTRLFGVYFGIFKFYVWTQNFDHGIKRAIIPHEFKIGLGYFNR